MNAPDQELERFFWLVPMLLNRHTIRLVQKYTFTFFEKVKVNFTFFKKYIIQVKYTLLDQKNSFKSKVTLLLQEIFFLK